jgi:hypothetical protein
MKGLAAAAGLPEHANHQDHLRRGDGRDRRRRPQHRRARIHRADLCEHERGEQMS